MVRRAARSVLHQSRLGRDAHKRQLTLSRQVREGFKAMGWTKRDVIGRVKILRPDHAVKEAGFFFAQGVEDGN